MVKRLQSLLHKTHHFKVEETKALCPKPHTQICAKPTLVPRGALAHQSADSIEPWTDSLLCWKAWIVLWGAE